MPIKDVQQGIRVEVSIGCSYYSRVVPSHMRCLSAFRSISCRHNDLAGLSTFAQHDGNKLSTDPRLHPRQGATHSPGGGGSGGQGERQYADSFLKVKLSAFGSLTPTLGVKKKLKQKTRLVVKD